MQVPVRVFFVFFLFLFSYSFGSELENNEGSGGVNSKELVMDKKQDLFKITTNLKGVVYDPKEPFRLTLLSTDPFLTYELKVMDQHENLLGTSVGVNPMEWEGAGSKPGLYKFEIRLIIASSMEEFISKGQFIIKD